MKKETKIIIVVILIAVVGYILIRRISSEKAVAADSDNADGESGGGDPFSEPGISIHLNEDLFENPSSGDSSGSMVNSNKQNR